MHRGTLDTVARDLAAALRAYRAAERREQQPQIVAYLRNCSNGRARVLDGVLLAQRDCGRNFRNRIDVRPLHPLGEYSGIRRKTLHLTALTFGVERVEDQA